MQELADPRATLDRLQEQTGGQITDGTVGTFVREKVYSEPLSSTRGEAVYVICDFCGIRVPGNAKGNHRQLVRKTYDDGREILVDEHKTRKYGRAWDAFLNGEDLKPEGMLLDDCKAIPRERLAALKAADVRTVEELAGLPDRSLQRIGMDGRALQRAAQGYLEEHGGAKRMETELEETKAALAELTARLDKKELSDGDTEKPRAKRGRKPRSQSSGDVHREHGTDSPEAAPSL